MLDTVAISELSVYPLSDCARNCCHIWAIDQPFLSDSATYFGNNHSYPSTLCQIVLDNVALSELSIYLLSGCPTNIVNSPSHPSTLCQIVLDNVALTELSINPLLDCATYIGIIPGLLVYPMCVYPIDLTTSRDIHPLF